MLGKTDMIFDGNDVNGKDVTPEELNISEEEPKDHEEREVPKEDTRLPTKVRNIVPIEPALPVKEVETMPPSGSKEPAR